MPTVKTIFFRGAMLCTTLSLLACNYASEDKHVFYSTIDRPTNVTIFDPVGDKPLWVKEIPVGQTLELDFDRGEEKEWQQVKPRPATHFYWNLYQNETNEDPIASDMVTLPGTPVVMKITYRPTSPEHPNP